MAAPESNVFGPILTSTGAAVLQGGLEEAERTRRDLDRLLIGLPREFPAKLTAYDSATGRWSWTLQAYDRDGRRRDAYATVTGSPTYAPAYAVGNGIAPPPAWPVEVWLRFRVRIDGIGPVYEFDWQCACDGGYSGSGGS
jgi:hypothetical protein